MDEISDECPLVVNGNNATNTTTTSLLGCTAYQAVFTDNNKYEDATSLEQACPVCPEGQVKHPGASCTLCGPASCDGKVTSKTFLDENATECRGDKVQDQYAQGYCVTTECRDSWTYLSIDRIEANEDCRNQKMLAEDGTVKLFVEMNNGVAECAVRDVASTQCRVLGNRAVWTRAPAHNEIYPSAVKPIVKTAQWARENHLGNGIGGQQNGHNFSLPNHIHDRCAIRVRYNITTKDYFVNGAFQNPHYYFNETSGVVQPSIIDSTYNKRNGNNPAKIELNLAWGMPTVASDMPYENARGYLWKNNPKVSLFDFDELVMYCHKTGNGVSARDQVRTINGVKDYTWCYPNAETDQGRYRARSAFCPNHGSDSSMKTVRFDAAGNIEQSTGTNVDVAGTGCNDNEDQNPICPGTVNNQVVAASYCQSRAMNNGGIRRQNGNDNNNDDSDDKDFRLQLAINTNQFGRTFQDRSHSYQVKEQGADERRCSEIHALNVRGKRGNIVQTFPGTEYDFVPNHLHVNVGSCIHFQWTGSNTNPNNNDGQGKRGTDRSNWAQLETFRGEGARGVNRYGGKGKDGTTWTTKDYEPGHEGYLANTFQKQPEMFDVQCDTWDNRQDADKTVYAMPFGGWMWCTNINSKTDPDAFRGLNTTTGQCDEAGYAPYAPNGDSSVICVRQSDVGTIKSKQRGLTTQWSGMNEDQRDPESLNLGLDKEAIGNLDAEKAGVQGGSHPEHLDNVTKSNVLGASREYLESLAALLAQQFRGEMSELDDAGTYADFGAHYVSGFIGRIAYLCTRNNNFSNRSQKGTIVVSNSMEATANCGMESCEIGTNDGAMIRIPENKSMGTVSVVTSDPPRDTQNSGSNVVSITMSNANVRLSTMPTQLEEQSLTPGERRRRQDASMESGLWAKIWAMPPSTSGGEDYTVTYEISSPVSKLLWMESSNLDDDHQYLCVKATWKGANGNNDNATWTVSLPTWNKMRFDGSIPAALRDSFYSSFENNDLWLDVTFPTNSDNDKTCSGRSFKGNHEVNNTAGINEMEITIPVMSVWRLGNVEHYTGKQADLCFQEDNQIACNAMSAEQIKSSDCDGEACYVKCTKNCNGYYMVRAEDKVPIIVGISLGVLIIVSTILGFTFYFRKNPEKWDSVKGWGPGKYKSFKLSMQDKI